MSFHFTERSDTDIHKKRGHPNRIQKRIDTEGGIFKETPTETINHADHWIEHIDGLKKRRQFAQQNLRTETDGGDVQTKLYDKWNDVAKVAVLNIQSCDIKSDAEGAKERQ